MECWTTAAHRGPRLLIDRQALSDNWEAVRSACPTSRMGAVVKNDAYGLGVAQVVPCLWELGCRDFWVSTADEALAVRASLPPEAALHGLTLWVLNGLGGCDPRDFHAHGLVPALSGPHELAALAGYAARHGVRMPVAMGMGISIISAICLTESDRDRLAARSLSQWFPSRSYGVVVRKGKYLSPQARAFIELIQPDLFASRGYDESGPSER